MQTKVDMGEAVRKATEGGQELPTLQDLAGWIMQLSNLTTIMNHYNVRGKFIDMSQEDLVRFVHLVYLKLNSACAVVVEEYKNQGKSTVVEIDERMNTLPVSLQVDETILKEDLTFN